jgi:hypothetical protein
MKTFIGFDGKPYALGDTVEIKTDFYTWIKGPRIGKVMKDSLDSQGRVRIKRAKWPTVVSGKENIFKKV